MRILKYVAALIALPSLVLTACGGTGGEGEAGAGTDGGGLECRNVDVIVPYSPGGGSDQQVRRLQPALEKILDLNLNITYLTGGDGSQGWNSLASAQPDGCTIANVVMPNIVNLAETGDVGFTADEFEYIAFTESSPNMILVDKDSEWKTFEDFMADAKANPGKLSWNGVGSIGELLTSEMSKATGLELTYVPVAGGVGDMIPQVVGGHVDAAVTGSSGLEGDQLRPLVLSTESDKFTDYGNIPTFDEAGYPGVKLETSWGFILPPDTPRDIVQTWNDAVQKALDDPGVKKAYDESAFTVLQQDVDEARRYYEDQKKATLDALEAVK